MTDEQVQGTETLELDELEYFLVLGVKKGSLEPVTIASPNVTLQNLGSLLGRATANHQLQIVQNGCMLYEQHVLRTKSNIVRPSIVGGEH